MANILGRVVLLLIWSSAVMSELNTDVCKVVKESYGLIPPPLPTNFELAGEFVDHLKEYASYFEMYFDSVNLRAKYMYLQNGIEHHLLFDYQVEQIIEYDVLHPGVDIKRDPLSHVCNAVRMGESEYRFIFGYKDGNFETKHSKMYNVNEALRFGGKYKYAFNGTEKLDDRGLLVDKFKGCVYDRDMEATIDYDVFFTNELVGPAGGTMENEVDDTQDNNLLSVPVKVHGEGTRYDRKSKVNVALNHTESLSWFQGYPLFEEKKFQIPPLMNCKNYKGAKEMPKFPLAFSTRLEMTNLTQDMFGELTVGEVISFQEIWYDNDKEMIRRDYKPTSGIDTEIFSSFQNYGPVKEVYDFKSGILYVTNKASGRCFTRVIRQGDFFETAKNKMYIKMGTPAEVFRMQTDDMEYKGRAMSRNIQCDVWNGRYEDKEYGANLTKETYFSTDGWHEEADEKISYTVPVKHTVIARKVDDDITETITELNFLKFKPVAPPLVVYDVSNCIETMDHKFLGIILAVPAGYESSVREYRFLLLENAHSYLTMVSTVLSFLRVQSLQLVEIDGKFVLTFALVGKANLKNVLFPQPGPTLQEAETALRKHIDGNLFVIKFIDPVTAEVKPIVAVPGSLLDLSPNAKKSSASSEGRETPVDVPVEEDEPEVLLDDEKKNVEEKKGMAPGSLALLSISMLVIGIAIGIALMYLYIRKFRDQSSDDYAMQHRTSES